MSRKGGRVSSPASTAHELSQILDAGAAGDGEFVFETERHARLVDALGLPRCAIATGYTYLEAGE